MVGCFVFYFPVVQVHKFFRCHLCEEDGSFASDGLSGGDVVPDGKACVHAAVVRSVLGNPFCGFPEDAG